MVTPCTTKILAGREYRCFFELTLQLIGGKWKPIIIYHLAIEGIMRFGELKRSIEGITERMLTRQLRELEKDGLVHRKVYHQVPPKVEYSLEPLGAKLIPILQNMREWGVDYERHFNGSDPLPAEDEEKLEPPKIAHVYRQHSIL
jgi:DNA-binding HxlR family transcriptional regulator